MDLFVMSTKGESICINIFYLLLLNILLLLLNIIIHCFISRGKIYNYTIEEYNKATRKQ